MAKGSRQTRLVDIAEHVGVSVGAVSCVLNHAGNNVIRVGTEKRLAILQAAADMHYVPDFTARRLAGKSSMTLGILIDSHAPQCDNRILWSIESHATSAGYRLMIGQAHDNPQCLFACYDNFISHGIDGIICLSHAYPDRQEQFRDFFQTKKNIVFLDPPTWDAPHVTSDREIGITEAIHHLYQTGRRRIGLWLPEHYEGFSYRQRLKAYDDSIHGPRYIYQNMDARACADCIAADRLDALLASNDLNAAQLARELMVRGVAIPQQMALVGHDNDTFSQFFFPSLTTIDQNAQQVGKTLVDIMLRILSGKEGPTRETIPTKLIVRESTSTKETSHAQTGQKFHLD